LPVFYWHNSSTLQAAEFIGAGRAALPPSLSSPTTAGWAILPASCARVRLAAAPCSHAGRIGIAAQRLFTGSAFKPWSLLYLGCSFAEFLPSCHVTSWVWDCWTPLSHTLRFGCYIQPVLNCICEFQFFFPLKRMCSFTLMSNWCQCWTIYYCHFLLHFLNHSQYHITPSVLKCKTFYFV